MKAIERSRKHLIGDDWHVRAVASDELIAINPQRQRGATFVRVCTESTFIPTQQSIRRSDFARMWVCSGLAYVVHVWTGHKRESTLREYVVQIPFFERMMS